MDAKIKCSQDLYWHQQPGYSGMLSEDEMFDPDTPARLVFKTGKEYKIVPSLYDTGNDHICIYAIGEDGKAYSILDNVLHRGHADMALRHFNFSKIEKALSKISA